MAVANPSLETLVKQQLETVCDPEITTVSIIDLGMVERVVVENGKATVELLPTFLGCPALGIINAQVERALKQIRELEEVEVKYITSPPWTSDRITEKGKEGLKEFGIAPPPAKLEEDGTGSGVSVLRLETEHDGEYFRAVRAEAFTIAKIAAILLKR